MNDAFITVIAIGLTAVLMFVFPLITMADRYDTIANTQIKEATSELIGDTTSTGKLTLENYQKFLEEIASTGATYDVALKAVVVDDNPGKKSTQGVRDKIGENQTYEIYTNQILDELENNGVYTLKEGDIISATVKNTNLTLAQQLRDIVYRAGGNDTYKIITTQSGMVTSNGETPN